MPETSPTPQPQIAPWDPTACPPSPPPPPAPDRARRRRRLLVAALGLLAVVVIAAIANTAPAASPLTPGPTLTPDQAVPRLESLLARSRAVLPPGADLRPGPVARYDCGTGRQSVYETVTIVGVPADPALDQHRWDALVALVERDWAARGYVEYGHDTSDTDAAAATQDTWQVEDEDGASGPGVRATGNGWDLAVTEVQDRPTDGVMLSANTACLWITGQPPAHR